MKIAGGAITNDAAKGEGTRGGLIIGHTKSGKPIYAGHHESHDRFSSEEHREASKAHAKTAQKYYKEASAHDPVHDQESFDRASNKSNYHYFQMHHHDRQAQNKERKGK